MGTVSEKHRHLGDVCEDLDRDLLLALDEDDPASSSPQAAGAEDHQGPAAKRRRLDDSAASAPCREPSTSTSSQPALRHASPSLLAAIPAELLSRVLSFLSAEDLAVAAHTCKLFQTATAAGTLWRRLYTARWGWRKEDVDAAKEWARPPTWKERYMERDTMEMQEVCKSVSELLRPFYAQMTAAKRSQTLGVGHAEDLTLLDSQMAGQLAAWRRKKSLPSAPPLHHACQGRCTYSHVSGSVHACERCGWAHLCGDACAERFLDVASGLPVCPITALCFGRMVTPWEEAREMDARGGARGGDDEAADQQEEAGAAGRLARAFVDGYNCMNEEELRRVCGVAL